MSAPTWVKYQSFLGTITQRTPVNIPITATGSDTRFSLIAGNFPPGLQIDVTTTATSATTTAFIFGFGEAIPTDTPNKFVIRASNADGITDKTFEIDVTGALPPLWFTPEGYLPVGSSGEYFTINNQIVDYQLIAEPNALLDNMKMRYYIQDGDGTLPRGLSLTEDGRIVGTVNELTKQEYDFNQTYGYDGLRYDGFGFDINSLVNGVVTKPKFMPVINEFYVTASDGFNTTKRLFMIHIVDANSLRGDTTYISADSGYFLSNDSYLFTPDWLNPANLGIRRAADYQIIPINLYDPTPDLGPVTWDWTSITVNPEIQCRASSSIDPNTYLQTSNLAGQNILTIKNVSSLPQVGQQFRFDSYIPGTKSITYKIISVTGNTDLCQLGFEQLGTSDVTLADDIPDNSLFYIGSPSVHPIGFNLDPSTGNLYGQIPYLPAYSTSYKFTIRMTRTNNTYGDVSKQDRVFSLTLQGSVNTDLEWVSTSTVGVIKTGYQSELFVKAQHAKDTGMKMFYSLLPTNPDGTDSKLPIGLTFKSDGTITGKIPYQNSITTLDAASSNFNEGNLDFTIDGGASTVDRDYKITIQATDVHGLNSITTTTTIVIGDNSLTPFSTLYVKPFMYRDKRKTYRNFINDSSIFNSSLLYRPEDPAFGIQSEIKLIIEHGLETLNLAEYVLGFQQYFYNKRFFFGDVKTLPANDEFGNYVYDLVYIDIVDSQMIANNRSPDTMQFYINQNIASYQIASIDNWQTALESIPIMGRTIMVDEYLRPRFMRTLQKSTGAPLGFIKAVPLCYAIPGKGSTVVELVNLSGFDFKLLDFEVDRLIITNTIDSAVDKYLKFPITDVDNTRPIDVIAGPDGIILQTEDGQDLFT
jgi:hypothetical protein